VNPIVLQVRNLTEAVPELLRLLVREGRSREDRLVVEDRVIVQYSNPFEGVVAWPQWPDSPLELFWGALENATIMDFKFEDRAQDTDQDGPLTFFVSFTGTDLRDAVGSVPTSTSIAMQFCRIWRRTPVEHLQLTYDDLSCDKALLDLCGELLLEVAPYPELGNLEEPIDEQAATELRAFVSDPYAIGYRSRFLRRVAVPMFQAVALTRAKKNQEALKLLAAAKRSAWVDASINWLEAQG
jgi:hypothetical protein